MNDTTRAIWVLHTLGWSLERLSALLEKPKVIIYRELHKFDGMQKGEIWNEITFNGKVYRAFNVTSFKGTTYDLEKFLESKGIGSYDNKAN